MAPRSSALAVSALAVVALGAGLWWSMRTPAPAPSPLVAAAPEVSLVTVHVSGAVRSPGLVEVRRNARVAEAIEAAGGATAAADLSRLNLAGRVVDGSQIVVPEVTSAMPAGSTGDGVRLNVATLEELQQLPGVGPVLASRILAYREDHGPFASVDDLLDVSGIGEATLASLRDVVIVP